MSNWDVGDEFDYYQIASQPMRITVLERDLVNKRTKFKIWSGVLMGQEIYEHDDNVDLKIQFKTLQPVVVSQPPKELVDRAWDNLNQNFINWTPDEKMKIEKVQCLNCGNPPKLIKQTEIGSYQLQLETKCCANRHEVKTFTRDQVDEINKSGGWTSFLT